MPNAELPRPSEQVTRRELWSLTAVTMAGVLLRVALPERMAIEHFDEGVYASNLDFSGENGFEGYPGRPFYAPPLLPWLIKWSLVFAGGQSEAALLVGIVSGCLIVPLVWWLVRDWFGAGAGLSAATLAAFSDFHVLYSRTALTEPLLLAAWILAVGCFSRGVTRSDLRWTAASGLATAAAWATKYNGWLPLAVCLSGSTAWWFVHRRAQSFRHNCRHGCIAAVVAVAAWSPVWIGLQDIGGYGAILENHARYVVGFAGWKDTFLRHWSSHWQLEGWLSMTGVALACALPGVLDRRTWVPGFAAALASVGFAAVLGSSAFLGLVGLSWMIAQIVAWWRMRDSGVSRLGFWLAATWFFGLLLATPLYSPYPRLTLPWLAAAWLVAGAAFGRIHTVFREAPQVPTRRESISTLVGGGIICTIGLLLPTFISSSGLARLTAANVPGWDDRSGLQRAADELTRALRGDLVERGEPVNRFLLGVYGEPALIFHLRRGDIPAVPLGSLRSFNIREANVTEVPLYLAFGLHATRDADFQHQLRQLADSWRPIAQSRYRPSRLVWLNHIADVPPADARAVVYLFRVD